MAFASFRAGAATLTRGVIVKSASAVETPQGRLIASFLRGDREGVTGALSIVGEELMSFGWYPIARRVGTAVWVRRRMYSQATGVHIKTVLRVLGEMAYKENGIGEDADGR